jgi:hypothetical protein
MLNASKLSFAVHSVSVLPTSGRSVQLDSVEPDSKSGHLIAKLTESPLDGSGSAQAAPAPLSIAFAASSTKPQIVELQLRRSAEQAYELVQTVTINTQAIFTKGYPAVDDRD